MDEQVRTQWMNEKWTVTQYTQQHLSLEVTHWGIVSCQWNGQPVAQDAAETGRKGGKPFQKPVQQVYFAFSNVQVVTLSVLSLLSNNL